MTEPVTTTEPTVAQKRAALRDAGYEVATRGKLSAEAEERYREIASR